MEELKKRISEIDLLINQWFIENERNEVRPPEIEQHLISKGYYRQSQRPGRYLRADLRLLESLKLLDLFVYVDIKRSPNYWCFKRITLECDHIITSSKKLQKL